MAIEDVYILPVIVLDQVGQSDPPVEQPWIFLRGKPARCQSNLRQCLPEAIARVGVIGSSLPGNISQRRPAEDEAQAVGQDIRDEFSDTSTIRPWLQLVTILFMSLSHGLSIAV